MNNNIVNPVKIPINMRSRVGFMWILTFFYQAGFILAWITTTSLFIEFFGIQNLLWLFLLEAGLMFLGSLLSHFFLKKVEISRVLVWTVGIIFLLISTGFFLRHGKNNQIEFLFLAILAKDLLYPRLKIGLIRKTESLFSPLQAEQAIPFIDSALTLGLVIMSGIILFVLNTFPSIMAQDLIFIWLIPLLLMGIMLISESQILKKIPHLYIKKDPYEHHGNSFKKFFAEFRKTKFLKYLLVVILLQSVLYTVTEFEFIRNLDANFEQPSAKISLQANFLQANIWNDIKEGAVEIADLAKTELKKTSAKFFAHETLLHDLTGLSLVFGILALLVQFFATPWVLQKWGLVRAINIYFAGFLLITMTFIFRGHSPINFVRGFEHGFHSLFVSGYHLSFYSVKEKMREFLRHIVEGMLLPLGIILGVLIVSLFKVLQILSFLPLIISILAAITFIVSTFLHHSRTSFAKKNFAEANNLSQKIRAIEVLGQSGHKQAHKLLADELKKTGHPQILREKIAETLTKINKIEVIHPYIQILEDPTENVDIKTCVLESMLKIKNLREYSQNRHFMRYKLINVLQKLFDSAQSSYFKKVVVMNIFQHLPAEEIVPFFHKIMNSRDEKLQAICLRSCAIFEDPDIVTFVEPYLQHSSPRVRSHALISLWKFSNQEKLREILDNFLNSSVQEEQIAGIYATGEVRDRDSLSKLYQFSREENLEIRLHSLIARAKFGDKHAVPGILELLFSADDKTAHKVFNMLKRGVPQDIREKIREGIYQKVAEQVNNIISPLDINIDKANFPPSIKKYLYRLYRFAGLYDDLVVLNNL